jgi:pectate lyase
VWFETAYAEWQAPADSAWSAQTRLNGGAWQNVDPQLVRPVGAEIGIWRVDVPGLSIAPGASYDLRILDASGAQAHIVSGLVARPFDRQGYAFSPNSTNGAQTTTGGYSADGTAPANAQIVYVTHQNMDEVLTAGAFSDRGENSPPLIIRILGQVGRVDFSDHYSIANNSEVPASVAAGAGGNRMYVIANSRNITIEGIGCDAYIEGWGIRSQNNVNVVIRNLKFDWWFDDAVHIEAANNSHAFSHTWVAHNTFGYGIDRYNNPYLDGEPDHVKGDGATDITNGSTHFTVGYNVYEGSGKSMLIGGGAGASIGHGTVHHNLFAQTSERTPRLRNGWVHVFNNIYDHVGGEPGGGSGYGIGAGHRANIVSEGNTFIHTYRPYIVSGELSSNAAGPNPDGNPNTLSNDAPGVIITSAYSGTPGALALTGRALVPDSLDAWSMNPEWFFADELTLAGGPSFANSRRGNGETAAYAFVPFHEAMNFRTDGQTAGASVGPAFGGASFPSPRAPINDTLSAIGVQSAADGAARVRELAGRMPAPAWRQQ